MIYCKPFAASLKDSSLMEIVSASVRFKPLSLNLYLLMVCELRAEQELPNVSCPLLYVEKRLLLKTKQLQNPSFYYIFFIKATSTVKKEENNSLAEDDEEDPGENSLLSLNLKHVEKSSVRCFIYLFFFLLVCCYGTLADSG